MNPRTLLLAALAGASLSAAESRAHAEPSLAAIRPPAPPAPPADASRPGHHEAPPVDISMGGTRPPTRVFTIEWNPLVLPTLGKLSANVVIMPIEHHSLILAPFYASRTTAPIYIFDSSGSATQLPEQTFRGFGLEIGYRHYSGLAGPRGFFVGPSLIVSRFTALAQDGTSTSYLNLGLAGDVGYEVLLGDFALALGGGLQYVSPSKEIPRQQFPAGVYANRGFLPRVLFSVGWAF